MKVNSSIAIAVAALSSSAVAAPIPQPLGILGGVVDFLGPIASGVGVTLNGLLGSGKGAFASPPSSGVLGGVVNAASPVTGGTGTSANNLLGFKGKRDGAYQAKPSYGAKPQVPSTNSPYVPPRPSPPADKPCGGGISPGLLGGVVDFVAPITCGLGKSLNGLLGFH
ncbi:hypothetical protein GGI12_002539 [Dipsacomyces acuminosporus]|nr:hypothetical protein GGI12_002539 [Dipsacomyces acuminosporus]